MTTQCIDIGNYIYNYFQLFINMLRKKLNKTQNKKNYYQNLEASNKQFTSPFWRLGLWAILPTLFHLRLLGSIELVIELVQRVQDCFTHIPDIWDSWKNGLIWIIQVRTLHTNFLGQWTSDMANQSFLKKNAKRKLSVFLKAGLEGKTSNCHMFTVSVIFCWSNVVIS